MILYEKKYNETGKDYAYRVLKDNIMCLHLKPGELLSESNLAQALNISRTPIREVLMRLKNEHLIQVKPQSGTYVSSIDKNLIKEAIFMRTILEKQVLKQACEDFPEDLFMELEKNLFAQKLIYNDIGREIEFHDLDKEFHKLIFIGCKKMNVWNMITNISTHYNRMRLLSEIKSNKKEIIEQHEMIIDIIKNKNVEKIEQYIDIHIVKPTTLWDGIDGLYDDINMEFKVNI